LLNTIWENIVDDMIDHGERMRGKKGKEGLENSIVMTREIFENYQKA